MRSVHVLTVVSAVLLFGCSTFPREAWDGHAHRLRNQLAQAERAAGDGDCAPLTSDGRRLLTEMENRIAQKDQQGSELMLQALVSNLGETYVCLGPGYRKPTKADQKVTGVAKDEALLASLAMSGPQTKWVVAVMDVQVTGSAKLEPDTQRGLTDQLRVFLASRKLTVVDRGQQEAALRDVIDEEKKDSYAPCVDVSCQIPLGKAVAASHILRTTIGQFGEQCTFNGELISLEKEASVAAATERSDCAPEALLDAAEKLSDRLVVESAR